MVLLHLQCLVLLNVFLSHIDLQTGGKVHVSRRRHVMLHKHANLPAAQYTIFFFSPLSTMQ